MKYTLSIVALTLLAACQAVPNYSDTQTHVDSHSPGDDSHSTGDVVSTSPESDSPSPNAVDTATTSNTDVEVDDPVWSDITWCQPQPIPYDVGVIPSLPEAVVFEGFCDATTDEQAPEGPATRNFVLDTQTRTLELASSEVLDPRRSELTFSFDEEGRVRHVYSFGVNGFYDTSAGASWYELDESGEMVHKVAAQMQYVGAPEEEWEVLVKEQVFDEERLLSRVERDGQDGPVVRTWTWTWQDGRLTEATLTDTNDPEFVRTWQATWTYHASGAPASVERKVDGVAFERESWTFGEGGVLISRTWWGLSPQELAIRNGGDRHAWAVSPVLDDHQDGFLADYRSNPWATSLPIHKADCSVLPHGPGHGYPDAESEYQLAVKAGADRPNGIGFAYGNDTYGWYYGDLAWYGHDGLGSSWLVHNSGAKPNSIDVSVHYDGRGAMIKEDAIVTFGADTIDVERTRSLDPGGAITADRVVASSGGVTKERTLLFERNDDGALLSRTLKIDDQAFERQTWERDAKGRALAHAVEDRNTITYEANAWDAIFSGFGQSSPQAASWFWRYEGDLLVERGGGNEEARQTMAYDEAGRLTEVVGVFGAMTTSDETRAYDSEGRIVEQCVAYDGTNRNCTTTTFDSNGRVAWKMRDLGEGPELIELNRYICTN